MTQPQIGVYLDAITEHARRMEAIGARFGRTRRLLLDADVAEDSFGLLPESRDSAKIYEQRTTSGLDVLRDGEDVFTDLADVMRRIRDGYRAADTGSANRLGGGR
jgi:hypothetical protein